MAIKIITTNKKALFDYFLSEAIECGISLTGTEIKSIRVNGCTISDAYVIFKNDQATLINMHIAPYDKGNIFNHEPRRSRKLLMHKKEIIKYRISAETKSLVVIPTKVYFSRGKVKVEIALAKPKKLYDKRECIKKKDEEKEIKKNLSKR